MPAPTVETCQQLRDFDTADLCTLRPPVLKRMLCAHSLRVGALAWASDSKHLVSIDQGGTIILWNAVDARVRQYVTRPLIISVAVAPTSDPQKMLVAVGGLDNAITICDMSPSLTKGEVLMTLPDIGEGHDGMVSALGFIDEYSLVSGGGDDDVRVWDLQQKVTTQVLKGHTQGINSIALNQEHGAGQNNQLATQVASCSIDGTVRLWDLRANKNTHIFSCGIEANAACFFPSSLALAAGCNDGTVRIFDTRTCATLASMSDKAIIDPCTGIQFCSSGRALYTAHGEEGGLAVWNPLGATSGIAHKILAPTAKKDGIGLNGLNLSPDGSVLAAPCQDSYVRIWGAAVPRKK